MIGRNAAALVAGQVATKALNVAVSLALVRWLGPAELGRYAYILAFAFPFGALADFGLSTLAIRDASRAPTGAADVAATARRLAALLSAGATAAMLVLAWATGHDGSTLAGLALAGAAGLASAWTMPCLALLTARERMPRLSAHRIAGALTSAALTVAVLTTGGGVLALLAASVVTNVAMLALARGLAGAARPATPPQWPAVAAMLRRAVPFGALMTAFAVYYRVDMVLLGQLAGAHEVGLYAAAYRFLDAVIALAAALAGPLFPRLASVAASDPAAARRLLEDAWRPLLALGLPLTVGGWLLAPDLTGLLFGRDFVGSATLLRWLVGATLPLLWVNVANFGLIALDRVGRLALVYAAGAAVNIAGNLVLVPRVGAVGAAASTLACEWLTLAATVGLLRAALGLGLAPSGLWRYAGATAAMAAAAWLASPLGVAGAVPAGAAAYAGGLWALGYVGSDDHRAVKRLLAQ